MSGLTFTGIDFETANSRRASIFAVGITEVKDGQATAGTRAWLIHPRASEISTQ